jgi:hypothetical protein
MKSIYMLSAGDYSDYHVIGLFSSVEKAEEVQKLTGGDIEEWPQDPWGEQLNQGLSPFQVFMTKEGVAEYVDLREPFDTPNDFITKAYTRNSGQRVSAKLISSVWAEDEAHAVKIVNEKRLQLLALDRWKEGEKV